jgi:hypothetical protein
VLSVAAEVAEAACLQHGKLKQLQQEREQQPHLEHQLSQWLLLQLCRLLLLPQLVSRVVGVLLLTLLPL